MSTLCFKWSPAFDSSHTWTCHVSVSSSCVTNTFGSPSAGVPGLGPKIHDILSIWMSTSSCQRVAFLHLCSKFVRISYAAGPSILQCQSCQGCLGPPASAIACECPLSSGHFTLALEDLWSLKLVKKCQGHPTSLYIRPQGPKWLRKFKWRTKPTWHAMNIVS